MHIARSPVVAAGALTAALLTAAIAGAAPPEPRRHVPDWTRTPAQIAARCDARIAEYHRRIEALLRQRAPRSFASFLEPLEDAGADESDDLLPEQILFQVSPDEQLRAASQQCNQRLSDDQAELAARPDIYRALLGVRASGTAKTDAERKLLEIYLTGAQRAGAALTDAKRATFVALQKQLGELELSFNANLGKDATTVALAPEQTAGLPDDFRAKYKPDDAGRLVVRVDESTLGPFMRLASDESARRAFLTAYQRRGGTANVALLERLIGVRDRLAKLLGFQSWAAFTLSDRTAKSPARVDAFLLGIDTALLPRARAEKAELAALKGAPIAPWDNAYYAYLLRKSRYDVDAEAIKRYFPAKHTIDAILGVYAKLFDVRFTLDDALPRWTPDVLAYDVSEADGRYIGSFFLDLYPRPGKYSHFADFPLQPHRVLADGTVRAPLGAIIGNWQAPADGLPALLSHGEVETFFHEFGHNMAEMFETTPYQSLSGFRRDFVEAPAQMLENWVWEPAILREISSNVDTGEPLPDDMIAKLVRSRRFRAASDAVTQCFYASVDMRYHSSGPRVDTTAVWRAALERLTPSEPIPGTYPQAAFGHLAGGYSAGYYGYLWSKVYAQDLYTTFKRGGLENPQVGRRYRATVLAPARTYEADVSVARFLGRPMKPDAFYRELGLDPPR